MINRNDYTEAMSLLGFSSSTDSVYVSGDILCTYKGNCLTVQHKHNIYATTKVENAIRYIEAAMQIGKHTIPITAAINTRNLAQNLVRVRSSNVWAIGYNVRNKGDNTGDLLIQFKGKNGGGSDLYIYYDVPLKVYRRFLNVPSKGHFVWTDIRNNYKYSRLTGSKKGVLPNAINNW